MRTLSEEMQELREAWTRLVESVVDLVKRDLATIRRWIR